MLREQAVSTKPGRGDIPDSHSRVALVPLPNSLLLPDLTPLSKNASEISCHGTHVRLDFHRVAGALKAYQLTLPSAENYWRMKVALDMPSYMTK